MKDESKQNDDQGEALHPSSFILQPSTTVAIPTYNRGPILLDTIRQLLALETRAAEIVVVDQTADHPPEIAQRLARHHEGGDIRLIRLPHPSIPHAMNVALAESRGDIVLFVDDDVIPSARLVRGHAAAYADPGIWAVVGQVLQPGEEIAHFDEATLRAGTIRDLEFRFNHDLPTDVQNVIACNLSVHRQRALSIGGFDENFVAAAYRFESDFALRIVAAGGRVRFEPAAALRHLHVPTGGVRAHGDHRRSAKPSHSSGDYYFARHHVPSFWRYTALRLRRNVVTRWHLAHPWAIPPKLVGELRGLRQALALFSKGRRLLE
jgi:GT2 family glycosyltransferase